MEAGLERRAIRIRGVVQGVGFRPAMFRLADALGLAGFVRNDRDGVWLEIEGAPQLLDRFVETLDAAAPPASRIDAVEVARIHAQHDGAFRIAESPQPAAARDTAAAIPADLAPCDDCLRELADPANRRHRYPFINCTACGPRFTIVREVPYDRAKTTMAAFEMCGACRSEYDDPRDRRFHAEPNACPVCGPRARIVGGPEGDEALRAAAAAIALARANPDRRVVFFGIGIETTAPANAMALISARQQNVTNFAMLASHVLTPPAIASILQASDNRVEAFLGPGHVCAVVGVRGFESLAARYRVPIVITGFEPVDLLRGVLAAVRMRERGAYGVANAYARNVRPEGNAAAKAAIAEVFDVVDRTWRGIGAIPKSGYRIGERYRAWDADHVHDVGAIATHEPDACISGLVLRGVKRPCDCPAFGTTCTPATPLGATMVSAEGACTAYHAHRRSRNDHR